MSEDTYFSDIPESEVHEALKPAAPWDAGFYDATINKAITYQGADKPFPCVQLEVTIVNPQGKSKQLKTWVLSRNPDRFVKQMGIQFLNNIGLVQSGRSLYRGDPAELVGRSGRVQVEVNGDYNNIKRFVKSR